MSILGCSTLWRSAAVPERWNIQGDHLQLPFFISFWRALKNNEIIQLNHFCQPHIETFWYFEVSLWSGEKSHAFPGCAKIVLWLHTARAKNPERTQIPNQTHLSTSDSYEYHPDISWTPPRHPPDTPRHLQGTRDANRWQQTPTETKSQPETPQDTDGCCLSMSGSVSWRLLVSFYSWRWQGGVWGTCGGVWGVSGGCRKVSECYFWKLEAHRCVLGSQPLQ